MLIKGHKWPIAKYRVHRLRNLALHRLIWLGTLRVTSFCDVMDIRNPQSKRETLDAN
jgi:hypothetical protein